MLQTNKSWKVHKKMPLLKSFRQPALYPDNKNYKPIFL